MVVAHQSFYIARLGVKTRVFHLGDYRRAAVKFGEEVPDDYFFVNGEQLALPFVL